LDVEMRNSAMDSTAGTTAPPIEVELFWALFPPSSSSWLYPIRFPLKATLTSEPAWPSCIASSWLWSWTAPGTRKVKPRPNGRQARVFVVYVLGLVYVLGRVSV